MAPSNGDTVLFCSLIVVIFLTLWTVNVECVCYKYNRETLLNIRDTVGGYLPKDINFHVNNVYNNGEIYNSNYNPKSKRKRKRGKRGGVLVRFRRRSSKPPLPSIVLSNVRSLQNKKDELFYLTNYFRDYRDCSIYCFSETWLVPKITDTSICPPGFNIHRADRSKELSEKESGGGVCFIINKRWCNDSKILNSSCTPDLETLFIECKPFYSPREFSSLILAAVYVPPDANATNSMIDLSSQISTIENSRPDSLCIVLGDFNHTSLSKHLPKFKQQVKCATRKDKTLDHCYCTINNAFHSIARSPLGRSDHNMVFLLPSYRQNLKSIKPSIHTVRRWDTDSIQRIQDCFALTDFSVFEDACVDQHELTDTVTSYIDFCQNLCVPVKTVKIYNNNKPWFNKEIKEKIIAKDVAFKSGDHTKFKIAKYDLQRCITHAKRNFKSKLEEEFKSGNSRTVWKGLQTITGYKQKPSAISSDNSSITPDKLNEFYARFDRQNITPISVPPLSTPLEPPFVIKVHEVKYLFSRQSVKKAAGPDMVLTATLKYCSSELAPVFTNIFNKSLSCQSVPSCFKFSSITPVPKKPKISSLNDLRPVALTSVVMKVFERLVLKYLKIVVKELMDAFQFAYTANRSVEDAVSLALHLVLKHLDTPRSYARILFIDYSSAFNTIVPQKLFDKLIAMSLDPSLCYWILDFLLERPQVVNFNGQTSGNIILNTGAPQGCVLSPLLYSLFTNDCVSHHDSVPLVKFADDATMAGLISNADETEYREEVNAMVQYSDDNDLLLNPPKCLEIVIDFRKNKTPIAPLTIKGENIEIVDHSKYFGTFISNDLTWDHNIDMITKKAQQRMYFLRQLKKFKLSSEILLQFYRAVIESILTSSIIVWYGNSTQQQKDSLGRIVKNASKIIGTELPTLDSLYEKRVITRSNKIIKDLSHPASHLFQLLPSRRRYRFIKTKTERFRNSLYPRAMKMISPKS